MLTIFELSNGQKYFSLFSLSPKILLIHNLTFNLGGNFTVQWDQTFLEVEKFTCYPDSNTATKETLINRIRPDSDISDLQNEVDLDFGGAFGLGAYDMN